MGLNFCTQYEGLGSTEWVLEEVDYQDPIHGFGRYANSLGCVTSNYWTA